MVLCLALWLMLKCKFKRTSITHVHLCIVCKVLDQYMSNTETLKYMTVYQFYIFLCYTLLIPKLSIYSSAIYASRQ